MATSYTRTNIETDLQKEITADAAKNKISFSAQIRRYKDLADTMRHGVN